MSKTFDTENLFHVIYLMSRRTGGHMEIGKQIKKCRTEMELSQEQLAEKIFVSRHIEFVESLIRKHTSSPINQ